MSQATKDREKLRVALVAQGSKEALAFAAQARMWARIWARVRANPRARVRVRVRARVWARVKARDRARANPSCYLSPSPLICPT